ncbi:MAG: flagellar hook assembly protein FlgD [Pseudomonadota bacterium]
MDVAAAAAQSQTTTPSSSSASLADDFSTFLTLLTAQLQNQDPLEPLETNEFTSQLVEFSSVEQQIRQNDNLETLIALQSGSSAYAAVDYIGKVVTAPGDTTTLVNNRAFRQLVSPGGASAVELRVLDSAGQLVYSTPGQTSAGAHTLYWDGVGSNGQPQPDGEYRLNVIATDQELNSKPSTVQFRDVVGGVDLTEDDPVLSVGNRDVRLSEVSIVEQVF